jgi:hypothetical protein
MHGRDIVIIVPPLANPAGQPHDSVVNDACPQQGCLEGDPGTDNCIAVSSRLLGANSVGDWQGR